MHQEAHHQGPSLAYSDSESVLPPISGNSLPTPPYILHQNLLHLIPTIFYIEFWHHSHTFDMKSGYHRWDNCPWDQSSISESGIPVCISSLLHCQTSKRFSGNFLNIRNWRNRSITLMNKKPSVNAIQTPSTIRNIINSSWCMTISWCQHTRWKWSFRQLALSIVLLLPLTFIAVPLLSNSLTPQSHS